MSMPVGREHYHICDGTSSPSPPVGEGRGGGSGGCGSKVRHRTTPTPDPSPAEPAYTRGSATSLSDRSRASPTSVGGAEQNSPLPAGRICPLDYTYDPAVFARRADFSTDILYIVGGLYGNLAAARAIERLAAAERGDVEIVYNGDFHWFPE